MVVDKIKTRIAVAMSTYNGEKYLPEQIESILAQKDVYVEIYIRDDGSSDSTISILKKYEKDHANIHVSAGNNVGFARSFLTDLASITGFKYYAFSDQDDYWQEDKLISAIRMLEKSTRPAIYYSNLMDTDQDLNVRDTTRLQERKKTLESVTMRRSIAGCTMVMNNELKELVCRRQFPASLGPIGHDSFIMSLAYSVGADILFDENSYIDYRQHSNNTTGASGGAVNRIKKEIKFWHKLNGLESGLASFLLENYSDSITSDGKRILKEIEQSRKSFSGRMIVVFSPRYATGNLALTLVGKLKAMVGRL
ncbi:glycosyltransferase [Bifidobacterium apri]|uniref:glycosyltransferase n=1 Tax=Bifidobacterium apri TaxID=1769423 RepID=UPI003991D4FB